LFGCEPKLPASIWWDVMVIINMNDPNVWIQACEHEPPCFDVLCWKIWQLPNSKIHCVMPLYVEVVIGLRFEGLNEKIMFTCNKQYQLLWIWLHDMLLYVCRRFYLLECCWKAKMVKHGMTMCAIVHDVVFPMWMAKWNHP
jgi:hypothetical protein